jgi:hypothetical protein
MPLREASRRSVVAVAAVLIGTVAVAACDNPSRVTEPPARYLSETLQRVAERANPDAGPSTSVDREELIVRESNAHLVPPMTTAANPLGWADRAERRCEEGFCTVPPPNAVGGGPR